MHFAAKFWVFYLIDDSNQTAIQWYHLQSDNARQILFYPWMAPGVGGIQAKGYRTVGGFMFHEV